MAKKKAVARPASKKPTKTASIVTASKQSDEIYEANKEKIDLALGRCTSHLKKLEPSVALEVIRRLKEHYLGKGMMASKAKRGSIL